MYRFVVGLMLGLCSVCTRAQVFETVSDSVETERVVVADGFWKQWYVQMGLDMTLQNPYGYDFAKVFPNGKSFGVDVAVGKWFTHQVGVRGKFNWENRLPLLENGHANWLAPFDQPGVNREKGGYIAFYGDVLLNLHNLFGTYRADRTWNMSLYPRIGVNYNFGVSKGSLLAGIGLLNTYRLNDRWSVYGDIAYIMTGSGFVGKDKVKGTGTGSNSNGYLTIGLGAQMTLGRIERLKNGRIEGLKDGRIEGSKDGRMEGLKDGRIEGWKDGRIEGSKDGRIEGLKDGRIEELKDGRIEELKDGRIEGWKDGRIEEGRGVLANGIWDNWFVEAGLDMGLMNPYGCNFSKVIPKGLTFGLNGALGKWFTPEFGLRGRVQWENGLIPNNGLEWVAPKDSPKDNYKKGGIGVATLDAMLNMTNTIAGYIPDRKWHTTAYLRMGLISQFVEGSSSPLMGVGLEETYRVTDRTSVYGRVGYQVSTSEGMGYSTTGVEVAAGSNGFFDIGAGIRYDLGQNKFYPYRGQSLCDPQGCSQQDQFPGGHNWPRFAVSTLASVGVAYAAKTALKAMIKVERPDHSDNKSFPSGHTAMAFAVARSIDKEFRNESIVIPIVGYSAATAVGIQRIASDRHHWYDVGAGALLGFASAELSWWISRKINKQ